MPGTGVASASRQRRISARTHALVHQVGAKEKEEDDERYERQPAAFRGLAYRESDGLEVSLLWSRSEGSLTVVVYDAKSEETHEIPAPPDRALEVFHHPFAQAALAASAA